MEYMPVTSSAITAADAKHTTQKNKAIFLENCNADPDLHKVLLFT